MQRIIARDGARVYLTRAARGRLAGLDARGGTALLAAFLRVGQDVLEHAVRVQVDPAWARGTWPRRRYPQQCYPRTLKYLLDHPRVTGARLVHGVISHKPSHIPLDHAWVELPGDVVFDGVVQAFFTSASYLAVLSALRLDSYTYHQANGLLAAHGHPGPWNTRWVPTPAQMAAYRAVIGLPSSPRVA